MINQLSTTSRRKLLVGKPRDAPRWIPLTIAAGEQTWRATALLKLAFFQGGLGGDGRSPALRGKLHFCLRYLPRQRAALPPRETSAWEEKSQLKGAKSLLCTELLRRRDILKLQVEQRALQMAGIKYNGPAMENHPMAAGWFLSCAATQSSQSECGTDHRRPRELPFFVVHRSLRERYSERAMGRYPLPPRSPRISPVQPFLLLAEPKTAFPCLTRAGEQALLAYKEKTPF